MGGGGKHRKGHSHRGPSSLGTSGFGRALLQQRLLAHEEQKRHLASLLHKDSQEERNSLSQIGFLEDGEGELEAPVGHPRHQGNEDGRKTLHEKVFSSCSPSSSSFHRAVGLSSSLSKHHLLEFLQSRSSSSSFPSQGGGRGSIRRKDLKSLTEQNELDHYLTTVLASQEKYFQTRGEAKLSPQEDSACIPILVKKSHGLREGEQDSSSSLSYQTRLVLDGDERLYLQGKTEEKEKEEIPIPRRPFQFPVSWFFFNEKKRGEDEEEEEGEGEKKKTERGEEEIMKRRRKREEERIKQKLRRKNRGYIEALLKGKMEEATIYNVAFVSSVKHEQRVKWSKKKKKAEEERKRILQRRKMWKRNVQKREDAGCEEGEEKREEEEEEDDEEEEKEREVEDKQENDKDSLQDEENEEEDEEREEEEEETTPSLSTSPSSPSSPQSHPSSSSHPLKTKTFLPRTAEEVNALEEESFLQWRRRLAQLEEEEDLVLTPFERNLQVWRQLWRVVERSHILLHVVDARDIPFFRSKDLEKFAKELDERKQVILLINKSDLIPPSVREQWSIALDRENIPHIFFSALRELKHHESLSSSSSAPCSTASCTTSTVTTPETAGSCPSKPAHDEQKNVSSSSHEETSLRQEEEEEGEQASEAEEEDDAVGLDRFKEVEVEEEYDHISTRSGRRRRRRRRRERYEKCFSPSREKEKRSKEKELFEEQEEDEDENSHLGQWLQDLTDHSNRASSSLSSPIAGSSISSSSSCSPPPSYEEEKDKSLPSIDQAKTPGLLHEKNRSRLLSSSSPPPPDASSNSSSRQAQSVQSPVPPPFRHSVLTSTDLVAFLHKKRNDFFFSYLRSVDQKRKRRLETSGSPTSRGKENKTGLGEEKETERRDARGQVRDQQQGQGPLDYSSQETDEKSRILTHLDKEKDRGNEIDEEHLERLLLSSSSSLPSFIVGIVGFPNVGKSSVINAIFKTKRVSVSRQPGKTRYLQTLPLLTPMTVDTTSSTPAAGSCGSEETAGSSSSYYSGITLCDCPGLVFPRRILTRHHLVVNGILPLDHMRGDFLPSVQLVCNRIPDQVLDRYRIPRESSSLSSSSSSTRLLQSRVADGLGSGSLSIPSASQRIDSKGGKNRPYGGRLPPNPASGHSSSDVKNLFVHVKKSEKESVKLLSAEGVLECIAKQRKFFAGGKGGQLDLYRVAKMILKDYTTGRLCACRGPYGEMYDGSQDGVLLSLSSFSSSSSSSSSALESNDAVKRKEKSAPTEAQQGGGSPLASVSSSLRSGGSCRVAGENFEYNNEEGKKSERCYPNSMIDEKGGGENVQVNPREEEEERWLKVKVFEREDGGVSCNESRDNRDVFQLHRTAAGAEGVEEKNRDPVAYEKMSLSEERKISLLKKQIPDINLTDTIGRREKEDEKGLSLVHELRELAEDEDLDLLLGSLHAASTGAETSEQKVKGMTKRKMRHLQKQMQKGKMPVF